MSFRSPSKLAAILTALTSLVALTAFRALSPQIALDDVQIEATPVSDGLFLLAGAGGNMALFVGQDGAFLIDDQFAGLTEKILAAVAEKTDSEVRFVVNTHWHPDHTGGNENLGKAGAILVAHENVRMRMSTDQFLEAFQMAAPASPEEALPVITFTESIRFHWNDDALEIFHVDPAHTDGDSIIHFQKANVFHCGDVFFNGMYPFIDTSTGGSIDGMVRACDRVLAKSNAETKIIPGHGALASKADLARYRDMLASVRDRIAKLKEEGKDRAAVIAAKPTKDLDQVWGQGMLQADTWVGIVFDSM